MYAEQFSAPSWLEEPSQWLWWAMQSRIGGNLKDALYNLNQFWTTLDPLKAGADTSTWPEILALDSQSHLQAANISGAIISEMEKDLSQAVALATFFSPTLMASYLGDTKSAAATAIQKMQDQRLSELKLAADLADQANTAAATRVVAVVEGRISNEDAERAIENSQLKRIMQRDDSMSTNYLLWVGAGLALLLLLKGNR
ncbi:MAG: hypothetical protein WCP34_15195 [Pseudomonadota bacterium]